MRIAIAERLRPFSHIPGTLCLVPGSTFCLRLYPALLRLKDLAQSETAVLAEFPLNVEGPVKDFTVVQDLEKGIIFVWGHSIRGFYRYHCFYQKEQNRVAIQVEKDLTDGLFPSNLTSLTKGPLVFSDSKEAPLEPISERLSLGNHKAQDWEMIRKRCAMEEIFPLWLRLGQITPEVPFSEAKGTLALLNECRQAMESFSREKVLAPFKKIFLAGLEGMGVPRLQDTQHQGFGLSAIPDNFGGSALPLLTEGALLIRRLFFQEKQNDLFILPKLPPEFHCGRYLGLKFKYGTIDLEWSKKRIRRLILQGNGPAELNFQFHHSIKSYRLRRSSRDKGSRIKTGSIFVLDAVSPFYLDNFEH